MSNKALLSIVGPSGSGKSTSLRNLNPTTTKLIDLEGKGFPFRGFEKFPIFTCDNMAATDKVVKECLAKAVEDKTELLVIDSFTKYTEYVMQFAKQSFKGYDIYNYFNATIRRFLDGLKNPNCVVCLTAIDEIVKIPQADGAETAARRIYCPGKEHEGKIEKEMLMVLFTEVKKDPKSGEISYHFRTNTDGVCSAKTPMEMFKEKLIQNDLKFVIDEALNYYKKS